MITQERLKELFIYNPATGWFINRITRGPSQVGCRAGSSSGHGYRRLTIDGERIYEHHAAWLYMYGTCGGELDHKDGNRANNPISNLRVVTRTQNNFNSEREAGASGLRGAYLDSRSLKWFSKIQIGGKVKWLGYFDSAQEAHLAFMAEAEKQHGEHAFHNRPETLIRRV